MRMLQAMAVAAAAVVFGCASQRPTGNPPAEGATQTPAVAHSLDSIRAEFNAHADVPRVVLLVSPTCSECVFGAQAVRRSIIDRFASRGVRAVVVWLPMLDADDEAAARRASEVFAGAPAAQFYDPERLAGWAYERERFLRKWDEVDAALPGDHWLREMVSHRPDPAPEWDMYMLYKAGARWEERAPAPDAFIRHIGRDEGGRSRFWRDRFDAPPSLGDLHQEMERMGRDVMGDPEAVSIELLGFPGCPDTPMMRENLRRALRSAGRGLAFREVNLEALPASDLRRGWPSPTVLVRGEDLFGMPPPSTPLPGCRVYPRGIPSAPEIASRLRGALGDPGQE